MERSQNIANYNYIEELYSSSFDNISCDTEHHMQISKAEGIILYTLLKAAKVRRVLEIGTLYGYSTKFICEAVGKTGNVITLEKSPESHNISLDNLKRYQNVECINADAVDFIKKYQADTLFDAIFIDADKTNYSNYLDLCTPLLAKGALLIADNTLMYGEVAMDKPNKFRPKTINAIKEFNKKLVESDLYESIIIPTNSGLTLAIKK